MKSHEMHEVTASPESNTVPEVDATLMRRALDDLSQLGCHEPTEQQLATAIRRVNSELLSTHTTTAPQDGITSYDPSLNEEVLEHTGVAISAANELPRIHKNSYRDRDDRHQDALMSLMKAVYRHASQQADESITTFVHNIVQWDNTKIEANSTGAARVPNDIRLKAIRLIRLEEIVAETEADNDKGEGQIHEEDTIARELGVIQIGAKGRVGLDDIRNARELLYCTESLEDPTIAPGGIDRNRNTDSVRPVLGAGQHQLITDEAPTVSVEEQAIGALAAEEICIDLWNNSGLVSMEEEVLSYRFGFTEDGRPLTLEDTAKIYDLTRERIRQIETRALSKLRRQAYLNRTVYQYNWE